MKNTDPFCGKCGLARTTNEVGQLICRPCMRANSIRSAAQGTATRRARTGGGWPVRGAIKAAAEARTLAEQRQESALDWFDAMCDLHDIGMTVPRMSPNAGRLEAGQSLYPRREVTA